eukprot:scaffold31814_cov61-Phaeocystis_antarctica.AAC.4
MICSGHPGVQSQNSPTAPDVEFGLGCPLPNSLTTSDLLEGEVQPDGSDEAAHGGKQGVDAPLTHRAPPFLPLGLRRIREQFVRECNARAVLAHSLLAEVLFLLNLRVELFDERRPKQVRLRGSTRRGRKN